MNRPTYKYLLIQLRWISVQIYAQLVAHKARQKRLHEFFRARSSPCYQNHHYRIILEPIMTKIQLFRFNSSVVALTATLVFVILAFQSRSTSANDVSVHPSTLPYYLYYKTLPNIRPSLIQTHQNMFLRLKNQEISTILNRRRKKCIKDSYKTFL